MYRIGNEEVEAIRKVIESGKLFRYQDESECGRFEERWADRIGVEYATMTASGSNALTAALKALGIGPGDEVLVPACTYMASAIAVLAVGAIPVVVEVDETTTIDPDATKEAVGPRTRAVMPVHMWGLSCDMDRIMEIADQEDLIVVEDACQAVGGAYEGKMLGSLGDVGVFSFNYYKNLSCGEGGAVVTDDPGVHKRLDCAVDCCNFYWTGRDESFAGYASNSARASEFEGAIMNVQLDRMDDILSPLRRQKQRVLAETEADVTAAPCYSLEHECGCSNLFQFEDAESAAEFADRVGGVVLINTGRHVYTEWDPVLSHRGAHHPALNPFDLPQNAQCRTDYTEDMCPRSLDILSRTVKVGNNPDRTEEEVDNLIARIRKAGRAVASAADQPA